MALQYHAAPSTTGIYMDYVFAGADNFSVPMCTAVRSLEPNNTFALGKSIQTIVMADGSAMSNMVDLMGDADDDLGRWDFLTRVYDRDDCFAESNDPNVCSGWTPTTSSNVTDGHDTSTAANCSLATFATASLPTLPSLPRVQVEAAATNLAMRDQSLPPNHVSCRFVVDVSNPTALFLPAQNVSFLHPASPTSPLRAMIAPTSVLTRSVAETANPSAVLPAIPPFHHFGADTCLSVNHWNQSSANQPAIGNLAGNESTTTRKVDPLTLAGLSPCPILAGHNSLCDMRFDSPMNSHRIQGTQFSAFESGMESPTTRSLFTSYSSGSSSSLPDSATNKPSGHQPCRPMSAYNYFYRDERANILSGIEKIGDPLPSPVSDFSQHKLEELLHQRWNVDPAKGKRRHRKMHGKIEFSRLSQVISQRWQLLPDAGREFYRLVASMDQSRYERYKSDGSLARNDRYRKDDLNDKEHNSRSFR